MLIEIAAKPLSSNVETFLEYIDVSDVTAKAYKENIKLFLNYLDGKKPTRDDILQYKKYLINNFKPTTVNARLISIKQFFKWLAYEGIYPNITENIKQVEMGIIDKNYPTIEEIKKILKSIDNNYDRALFTLLIGTGIRLKEARNANIEDIKELHGEKVLYVQGKGRIGKEEYVKLSDSVLNALESFLNGRKDGAIFLSTSTVNHGNRVTERALYDRIKHIYEKAGIPREKFTIHALRGTFSMVAMENGANIYEISKVLRHKNIHTTEYYLRGIDRSKNKTENIVSNALFG